MTNKLVVILNSLKIPKIMMFFSISNEISCTKIQLPPEHLTTGLPPPDPRFLCTLSLTEFVDPPPSLKQNSWVRHCCVFKGAYPGQCYSIFEYITTYSSVYYCFLLCFREPICTHGIQSCIGTAAVTF